MQARDLDKQTARETANKAKQYETFHVIHSKFVRMIHSIMSRRKLTPSLDNLNPACLVYNVLQLGLFWG